VTPPVLLDDFLEEPSNPPEDDFFEVPKSPPEDDFLTDEPE
jgi:hypothetical protein